MAVHGFILRVIPKGRVKRFFRLPSHFYCISVGLIPGSCGSAAQSYISLAREGKMVGLSQNPDLVATRRLRRAAAPTLIALALLCEGGIQCVVRQRPDSRTERRKAVTSTAALATQTNLASTAQKRIVRGRKGFLASVSGV
jgi:hypothetical protein